METKIYIDILVILNIYVTYLLILSTKKLFSIEIKRKRFILSSIIGGIYSLIILVELNTIYLTIIKLVMGISIVLIAFGFKSIKFFIKTTLSFFIVNFIFAGLMIAIWFIVTPSFMQYKNGVVFFDISPLVLTIVAIVAYLAISLFCRFFNKRVGKNELYSIYIEAFGKSVSIQGFVDTGNKITDMITGLPVIVCEYEAIKSMIPNGLNEYFKDPICFDYTKALSYKNKLSVIPIKVVNGTSTIGGFRADKIVIMQSGKVEKIDAVIGVTTEKLSDGSYNALLNI